jgi:hypothetical protein
LDSSVTGIETAKSNGKLPAPRSYNVLSAKGLGGSTTRRPTGVWSEKQPGIAAIGSPNADPAPDGKRIVALMPAETVEGQKAQSHLIFLINFFDELRRKVPAGK